MGLATAKVVCAARGAEVEDGGSAGGRFVLDHGLRASWFPTMAVCSRFFKWYVPSLVFRTTPELTHLRSLPVCVRARMCACVRVRVRVHDTS